MDNNARMIALMDNNRILVIANNEHRVFYPITQKLIDERSNMDLLIQDYGYVFDQLKAEGNNDYANVEECILDMIDNDVTNGEYEFLGHDISYMEDAICAYENLDETDKKNLEDAIGDEIISWGYVGALDTKTVKIVFDRFFFQDILMDKFILPESKYHCPQSNNVTNTFIDDSDVVRIQGKTMLILCSEYVDAVGIRKQLNKFHGSLDEKIVSWWDWTKRRYYSYNGSENEIELVYSTFKEYQTDELLNYLNDIEFDNISEAIESGKYEPTEDGTYMFVISEDDTYDIIDVCEPIEVYLTNVE